MKRKCRNCVRYSVCCRRKRTPCKNYKDGETRSVLEIIPAKIRELKWILKGIN